MKHRTKIPAALARRSVMGGINLAIGVIAVSLMTVMCTGHDVYAINDSNVGIARVEPWRAKTTATSPTLERVRALVSRIAPDGALWDNGSDTTAEDGLLKDVYEKTISEGVNNKFQLRDAFKLKPSPWDGGKGLKWNAHTGRNTSVMAVGQDSAFAVADHQKSTEGYVTQKKIMARWRVTEEALEDSRNSEAAYRSVYTDNMNRMVDDIAYRDEFYLGTDGRGIFGTINEATPSADTTLELKNPGNVTGTDFGNRYIQKGMYLAAINPATGAIRAGIVKVVDVNEDGTDVTTDATPNAAWTQGDYIVQAAHDEVTDVLDTAYEKAPWGIMALIDDGTYRANYFGITRSLFPAYKSYVVSSTTSLSFDLLQRVSDVVNQKLGGEIDAIWCHHSIRRLFILLTQADRRYADAAARMNPDGGTAAFKQRDLTMGAVDIKAIRTFPLATMVLVDTKGADFVEYVSEKGKWVDRDGSILRRDGSGKGARHAYEAWWYRRHQRFVRNPGKCASLQGITGQTLVVVRGE